MPNSDLRLAALLGSALLFGACQDQAGRPERQGDPLLEDCSPHQDIEPQDAAFLRLRELSSIHPEIRFHNGFPRSVRLNVPTQGADAASRAKYYLSAYSDLYRQGSPRLATEVRRVASPH